MVNIFFVVFPILVIFDWEVILDLRIDEKRIHCQTVAGDRLTSTRLMFNPESWLMTRSLIVFVGSLRRDFSYQIVLRPS